MIFKYKKLIRPVNVSDIQIIRNIGSELEKRGYLISHLDNRSITFKDNFWRLGSRSKTFKRVDGGKFEINPEQGNISFTFYISLTFEIVVTAVMILIALFDGPVILFLIIFFWLMFFVRVFALRAGGKQLFVSLIKTE